MIYYANDQVATSIDRNNATTTYTYDGAGNVVTVKSPQTGTTTYTYDGPNRKVTETNDKGNTTTYQYDAVGNIEKIIAPDRFVTTQVYDDMNHLIKLTNGCLETCEYAYDKWGRKESVTDGNGHQTTYRYDLAGNVCEVTNALGEKTSFTYDKENRLLTTTNPVGYVSSQTYDAVGNVETTTDAEGRTTKTLYTNHGDVKYQYDGEGHLVASMTYDAAYNLETVTDALGHTTTNTYTNMNQLKTSINPLGQKKIRGYDNRGNLNEVVDPPVLGGRETVITKALYNAKGQVKSITDPEGNVQSYDYDTLGNLKYEHTAFGGTNSYTYNALNLMETSKNARGQSATYTYDAAGRVATMKDEVDETIYKYDKNGNLIKVISKNNGTITRTFDALNRVKTYTDARGNTISYDYDQAGNLSKMTYPNGQVVTYQYDRAGLLTDVIDFNGGVTHYEYDSNGCVRMMTRPNGTSKETTYDALGQVKTVVEKNSQGEIITQLGYDYDAAGNMVKETGLNENPELPSGETVMTYGKGNRLETYNGETVTYDADGNMTHGPLNGKMVDFVYDARNRLIQAGDTTYLYDAENNRIGMIEAGVKTTYTINPHASLTEVLQSKKGDKVTQYIYGTGLIMQVTGGEYATYHYDFRGSTVAITDGKGRVTDTFTYSPYGKLLGRTGTTDTPFLYNGMYGVETDDNGLYCMRSRYYNPTIMRFINQDVVQGSLDNAITLNRYAYANGNPITYLDPFGTSSEEINDLIAERNTYFNRQKQANNEVRVAYTPEMYERDMAEYRKEKFWSDCALGAMSPFIAANEVVQGTVLGIGNLVFHPIQSGKALIGGICTLDASKNVITAPLYHTITNTGSFVSGKMSPEELVDYQVNVFYAASIAYGGAKGISGIKNIPSNIKTTVSSIKTIPSKIKSTISRITEGAFNTVGEGHNVVNYAKLKEQYRVTELSNDVVESLQSTGQLPSNYITKAQAQSMGWNTGKAIGGDIFSNSTGVLPNAKGRIWYEADVGMNYMMGRNKNPGYRIVFSNDGLIYGTYDHYNSVFQIGTY